MNTYCISIKKGAETQEYDLESEETYHALAHRLWDETFGHQPTIAHSGFHHGMPCSIYDSARSGNLEDEPENRVMVIDESYPERQKRAHEALARVLALRTTPPGLCTYHVTIKRGNQVQEYDMDSSEYYVNVAKRLWKENFSHKPTQAETVSSHQPGGCYVPRHIIDDAVKTVERDKVVWLPPENVEMLDGDPDPKRRMEIWKAIRRAAELRNTPSGIVTYHVTVKNDGETQEYDVESDKNPKDVPLQIWLQTLGSPPKRFVMSDRGNEAMLIWHHGGKGFSKRADERGIPSWCAGRKSNSQVRQVYNHLCLCVFVLLW